MTPSRNTEDEVEPMEADGAIELVQVDAFTAEPFAGNPAAVCFLPARRPDAWLAAVAAEMNLSETAFLMDGGDGGERYGLRWFTPAVEVPLCGHATLASAHAVWERAADRGDSAPSRLVFDTLSGELAATREGDWICLDLPAKLPVEAALPPQIGEALGVVPRVHCYADGFHLLELDDEDAVRGLSPKLSALGPLGEVGVIATAASGGAYDFVSRVFAPGLGIDEDPVTGAAHCMLAPFWTGRLGRDELVGYQASARSGVVRVRMASAAPGRVELLGQAVSVMHGSLCG